MMKTLRWVFLVFAVGIFCCAGCKKKQDTIPTTVYGDTPVDFPKLQQAFVDAPMETLNQVTMVGFGLRYGDPVKSLVALESLSNNPSLTEPQKQIVATVTSQVQAYAAKKAAEPPPPAQ